MIVQRGTDDCLSACVANIMGRDIEDVFYRRALNPDGTSIAGKDGTEFYDAWMEWCKSQGWKMDGEQWEPFHISQLRFIARPIPKGEWIAVVIDTWRGPDSFHAILMDGRKVRWDPSPSPSPSFFIVGWITVKPRV